MSDSTDVIAPPDELEAAAPAADDAGEAKLELADETTTELAPDAPAVSEAPGEQAPAEQDNRPEQHRRLNRQKGEVARGVGQVVRGPAIEHAIGQLETVGEGKTACKQRRARERTPWRPGGRGIRLHGSAFHLGLLRRRP